MCKLVKIFLYILILYVTFWAGTNDQVIIGKVVTADWLSL